MEANTAFSKIYKMKAVLATINNFRTASIKTFAFLEKRPEYWISLIIKKGTQYHLPLNLLEGWYFDFLRFFNETKVNIPGLTVPMLIVVVEKRLYCAV